ncbi:MAG: type II secretion system F family protein [Deltaproteobacteria bacterium]|nr:type II secretion system F family protein [Deltaproteobacteria bacterium]
MPHFTYKAVNQDGGVVRGSLEGSDAAAVTDSIASSGLYVLKVSQSADRFSAVRKTLFSKRVRRSDIIDFSKNLAVMLKAGVPILLSFSDIASTTENKYFREAINSMRRRIELGAGFSEAAAACGKVFPDIFIRITMVGEQTGNLEKSLFDVAEHLQKIENLVASIKRALMYPVFAIVSTLGALLFWLMYVLPKVMEIFYQNNLALPLPTRILLYASNFCTSYWYLILIMPIAAVVLIKVLIRDQRVRYYYDYAKIKLPVIRLIVYNRLLALFAEQMRILTVAGITIDRSLAIVSDVIGNEVFRRALHNVREEIALGSRISDAIGKQPVFPSTLTKMIDIGESSGSLDAQFAYLSDIYLTRLDDISQKMGKIIEPIVIGVIGGLFAIIIMGLLLPIYDLVSKVGS